MKYRISIKEGYHCVSFAFDEAQEASDFAWRALEQAEENIEVTISIDKEEEK